MEQPAIKLYEYLEKHEGEMLSDLEGFVKKESPSHDKDLVDNCGKYLMGLFKKHLGIEGEVLEQNQAGNHLKFTVGDGDEQILIVGHFDTVWEKGRLDFHIDGNKAYGPGIFDMKGGIIQAIWALKALEHNGIPLNKKIVFLCTTDEEIGSPSSRKHIEREAKKSEAVLVVEPPVAKSGALKTSRKGVLIYKLEIHGQSSHAGNDHEKGINAIEELAKQIVFLHGLTDYKKGTTVNVGVIKGGTLSNVVPDYAEAEFEVRVSTEEEADRISALISDLKPITEGTRLHVTGGINRPPMEKTEDSVKLFQDACSVADELHFSLKEAFVGGGSDGSFTAAIGVPTLDGLGAEGAGIHAEHEHVLIDALPKRAALIGGLLLKI